MKRMKLGLVTKTGHGSIHEELKLAAGNKFAEAVMICFKCDVCDGGDSGQGYEDDSVKQKGTLDVEERITETLETCKV